MELELKLETKEFLKELEEIAKNTPEIVKKSVKKMAGNCKKSLVKRAKTLVKRGEYKSKITNKGRLKSINYHNSFKVSKVFGNEREGYMASAMNTSPHGHLIEFGHKQVTKNGKTVGFVPGKYVVEKGKQDYLHDKFEDDVEKALEEVIKKGGY